MPSYRRLEEHLIDLFNSTNRVIWKNKEYTDISAYKPKVQNGGGECKTDIYVALRASDKEDYIKITVKKSDAEFLANKMTVVDAEAVLGDDWEPIVLDAINSLEQAFKNSIVIYAKPNSNPKDLYFTLGWKLEITNKVRTLSSRINLPKSEIVDKIYRGTDQPDRRRDAIVANIVIKNSGVADYLLEGDISDFLDAQSVLDRLINLESYTPSPVYLAFTANNYRLIADKADGKRTLAVAIKWSLSNDKLVPEFIFNQPLVYQGETHMMPLIKEALSRLGITTATTNLELLKDIDIDSLS